MDLNIPADDPTLGDAMAQLAAMEAQDSQADNKAIAPADAPAKPQNEPTPDSTTTGDERAPEAGKTEVQPPEPDPAKPGAPADADKQQTTEQNQSKFAKNQQRLEGGWKQLNERKVEIGKREESVAQREKEFETRVAQWEASRRQSQPTPEQYEKAAADWEKAAESLEARSQFDEADEARVKARLARKSAKELRDNPPPPPAEAEAAAEKQHEAQTKEWWSKAAIDFPNCAKQGSPEALALEALIKAEPEVLNHPKGMYWLARLSAAETAAARVPSLEKEKADLSAKVKELNEKLAVPTGGSASSVAGAIPFEQLSEQEQLAALQSDAQQLDRG